LTNDIFQVENTEVEANITVSKMIYHYKTVFLTMFISFLNYIQLYKKRAI